MQLLFPSASEFLLCFAALVTLLRKPGIIDPRRWKNYQFKTRSCFLLYMFSYRPLRISVSLRDKHDYSPRLCHSNHTSLPTPPCRPLAIYPDMCNQLEQQILAGEKKKNLSSSAISLYCLLYATFTWTSTVRIEGRRKSIFQQYFVHYFVHYYAVWHKWVHTSGQWSSFH